MGSEDEKGTTRYLTQQGFDELKKAYVFIKESDEGFGEFACNVANRCYTEWCMSFNEGKGKDHAEYQGEGFVNWVRDETHSYIIREGYKFIETAEGGIFVPDGWGEGTPLSREGYLESRRKVMRTIIIEALVYDFDLQPSEKRLNLRKRLNVH